MIFEVVLHNSGYRFSVDSPSAGQIGDLPSPSDDISSPPATPRAPDTGGALPPTSPSQRALALRTICFRTQAQSIC